MILRNSKGKERHFKVLFKLDKNGKTYIVYQDEMSGKYYGGLLKENKLKVLNDDEMMMINKVLERIKG